MKWFNVIIFSLLACNTSWSQDEMIFKGLDGSIDFVSEAPLELIQAQSNDLEGVIDANTGRFAFQVKVNSFEGFNSSLQRVHFQENYLETDEFPNASFEGKIVDHYDMSKEGTYSVRAKGKLNIHGIVQERIIRGDLIVDQNNMVIKVEFNVLLEDHNIRVPRIVHQKISEEINISLRIELN